MYLWGILTHYNINLQNLSCLSANFEATDSSFYIFPWGILVSHDGYICQDTKFGEVEKPFCDFNWIADKEVTLLFRKLWFRGLSLVQLDRELKLAKASGR